MEKFPEKTDDDFAHSSIKGIISGILGAGGPLSVLFETIFTSPIEKRKKEWFIQLGQSIENLTNQVENLSNDALSQNEKFISVAIQASQIALRNHQEEKLNALRNCIINTALDPDIDENKALIFTRIIDTITPLHLNLLRFLKNPEILKEKIRSKTDRSTSVQSTYTNQNLSNSEIWYKFNKEYKQHGELINLVIQELSSNGFISVNSIDMGFGSTITEFGKEFIEFITQYDKT